MPALARQAGACSSALNQSTTNSQINKLTVFEFWLSLYYGSSAFAFKITNASRVSGDRQSRRRLQINPASETTRSDGADVVLPSCTSKCLKTRPVPVSLPASARPLRTPVDGCWVAVPLQFSASPH